MNHTSPKSSSAASILLVTITVIVASMWIVIYLHGRKQKEMLAIAQQTLFPEPAPIFGYHTHFTLQDKHINYDGLKSFPREIIFESIKAELEIESFYYPRRTTLSKDDDEPRHMAQVIDLILDMFGDDGLDHVMNLYLSSHGRDSRTIIAKTLCSRISQGNQYRSDDIKATLIEGLKGETDKLALKSIGIIIAETYKLSYEYARDDPAPHLIHGWLLKNIPKSKSLSEKMASANYLRIRSHKP